MVPYSWRRGAGFSEGANPVERLKIFCNGGNKPTQKRKQAAQRLMCLRQLGWGSREWADPTLPPALQRVPRRAQAPGLAPSSLENRAIEFLQTQLSALMGISCHLLSSSHMNNVSSAPRDGPGSTLCPHLCQSATLWKQCGGWTAHLAMLPTGLSKRGT